MSASKAEWVEWARWRVAVCPRGESDMGYFAGVFRMPTRGGKLTVVNCLLWGVVALGAAADWPLLAYAGLIACWPVAWLFFLPSLDPGEVVVRCIAIGVNAFLWGYGISWVVSRWTAWRTGREAGRRGFEVVVGGDEETPAAGR